MKKNERPGFKELKVYEWRTLIIGFEIMASDMHFR